jgi:replicative DNA helicase
MATIPDLTLDTGMPASVEAEKTILGAILLDNTAHSEAAEKLDSDDFSLDSHRRIFLRMSELINEQRAVDIVTLSHELARYKEVESVGGVAYLASLTEGLPRRPVIDEYIRIVKDKSLLRKLMGICSMAIARAADQSESALDVLGAAEAQLMEVRASNLSTSSSNTPSDRSIIFTSKAVRSPDLPPTLPSLIV